MNDNNTPVTENCKVGEGDDVNDNGQAVGADADTEDEIKNHEIWTHGDFEVISSDNVRFRIPSYHLFSHSPVFRPGDLFDNAEKRLAFTDEEFETAVVIELFLDLVLQGDITGRYENYHDLMGLARFLTKYDCNAARAGLILHLRRQITKEVEVVYQFCVAAYLDDYMTCKVALDCVECWDEDVTDSDYGPYDDHRDSLDPAYMPFGLFTKLPSAYGWALVRAWAGRHNLTETTYPEWRKTLPDRFEDFINQARGQTHS